MILPGFILTESAPSEITVAMSAGVSVGSTTLLEFEPILMLAGISVGVSAVVAIESMMTMGAGASVGVQSGIEFHDPLNYLHTMTVGISVGGAATYDGPEFMTAAASVGVSADVFFFPEDAPNWVSGTLIATAPDATALLTVLLGTVGTVTAKGPMATASLVGGPQSIFAKAPMATAVLTALVGSLATITAQAPRATGVLTATVTGIGVLAARAPMARAVITASAPTVATITAAATRARAALTAYLTVRGVITVTAPMATSEFSGGSGIVATILVDAPMARIYLATGQSLSTLVGEVVANTVTGAVTEYINYGFDSFAIIGGTHYAAGSDGIYELDVGGTDQAAPIAASFETGAISFKSEYLKRMESVYAAYRTTGDILVSVRTDEGKQYTYNMKYDHNPLIKQRRVPIGKGLKGKYWQFKFENVGGASFGFDTFNLLAHETVRRIGV
jgi:hypothetical protein